MKRLIAGLFIAISLVACGAGPHAVTSGTAVEYINNIEVRQNGQYDVWLDNDATTDYCTFDKSLYLKAVDLAKGHKLVVIQYNGINAFDKDGENILTGAGCEATENVTTLRLTSIDSIDQ